MIRTTLVLPVLVAFGACSEPCPPCEAEAPAAAVVREAEIASKQLTVAADSPGWKPCPPNLPKPCEMAVLEGNPREEMLFTVRFRAGAGFLLAPHTHPGNERVTILKGRVGVGFGDTVDKGAGRVFGPGDYYVTRRGVHHFVWIEGDEPAELQITGIGPWKADFLDAK